MKATFKFPTREYPYLAIFTSGEPLLEEDFVRAKRDDIVLISMISKDNKSDAKPYVQYLFGDRQAYFTEEENAYTPLPKGTEITFIQ